MKKAAGISRRPSLIDALAFFRLYLRNILRIVRSSPADDPMLPSNYLPLLPGSHFPEAF